MHQLQQVNFQNKLYKVNKKKKIDHLVKSKFNKDFQFTKNASFYHMCL